MQNKDHIFVKIFLVLGILFACSVFSWRANAQVKGGIVEPNGAVTVQGSGIDVDFGLPNIPDSEWLLSDVINPDYSPVVLIASTTPYTIVNLYYITTGADNGLFCGDDKLTKGIFSELPVLPISLHWNMPIHCSADLRVESADSNIQVMVQYVPYDTRKVNPNHTGVGDFIFTMMLFIFVGTVFFMIKIFGK